MKVLLVVDPQNDFCPGGSLAVNGGDEIIPVVNELLQSDQFDLRIASKDWHPENHISFVANSPGMNLFDTVKIDGVSQVMWPTHCVQGEPGAEFHPKLRVDLLDAIIEKGTDPKIDSYSAFFDNARQRETPLRRALEAAQKHLGLEGEPIEVVVCGLALDFCVAYTARDAAQLGYSVKLVLDATRPVESDQKKVIAMLRDLQDLGVKVVESRDLLAEEGRSLERETRVERPMEP